MFEYLFSIKYPYLNTNKFMNVIIRCVIVKLIFADCC